MGLFKDLYEEQHSVYSDWNAKGVVDSENNKNELTPRDKHCSVFVGRFQPFTKGHLAAVQMMIDDDSTAVPVIALVKGGSSSKDGIKNPFEADFRAEIIESALKSGGITNAKIVQVSNSFVTQLIEACRVELELEATKVFAGGAGDEDDRFGAYIKTYETSQITRDGKKMSISDAYDADVTYVDTAKAKRLGDSSSDKELSGTNARQSLKDDDFAEFTNQTGITDEKLFEKMKEKVNAGMKVVHDQIKEVQEQIAEKEAAGKATKALNNKLVKLQAKIK
jgi:hypothetical protein